MSTPLQTIVETPPYLAPVKGILPAGDRAGIVEMIACDPCCGAVIKAIFSTYGEAR